MGSAGGHCGLRDIWSHALECKQTRRITQRWIEKTSMPISYSFRGKSFCLIFGYYSKREDSVMAAFRYGDIITCNYNNEMADEVTEVSSFTTRTKSSCLFVKHIGKSFMVALFSRFTALLLIVVSHSNHK